MLTSRNATRSGHATSRTSAPKLWRGLFLSVLLLEGLTRAQPSTPSPTPTPRSVPLKVPTGGKDGFTTMLPESTGILFSNRLSEVSASLNQVMMNGSGVALGDIDGDGLCDVYFSGLEAPNRLYRNLGNWRFEEVTAKAGVGCVGQFSTGAVFADVDGDGDVDLLVNSIGKGTRLFLNQGSGAFSEATSTPLSQATGSMSMALADLDGDGDLDLYVCNYRTNTIRSTGYSMIVDRKGRIQPPYVGQYEVTSTGRLLEYGEPDALFLNEGRGKFTLASWTDGRFVDAEGKPLRTPPRDWGLSVMIRDFDGNGSPDIYVCNDFWSPDRLWLNDGKGHFRAAPPLMLRHTSNSSMGIDVADIDRDGRNDFVVLDMLSRDHRRRMRQRAGLGQTPNEPLQIDSRPQVERNTLFWNRGDGTFAEIAQLAGLQASEWSWGAAFLDVDLDGFEDLLVTAGNLYDMLDDDIGARLAAARPRTLPERLRVAPKLDARNSLFRNRGDLTFQEVGADWGFNAEGISHGMALADLDNDGDLDVVVNQLNAGAGLYRNNSSRPRVAVRLKGGNPNTQGIGARLRLKGGPIVQTQSIVAGGRYLSGDDPIRTFAAWDITNRFTLEVEWPSGASSSFEGIQPQTLYEIAEPMLPVERRGGPNPTNTLSTPEAWFADVSERLKHQPIDTPFDNFAREPLLSRRLDSQGPTICWFDSDGDGLEDLWISGGKGGELGAFRNVGNGQFQPRTFKEAHTPLVEDQSMILGWTDSKGNPKLLISSDQDEEASNHAGAVMSLDPASGGAEVVLPKQVSGMGPMALGDIDGDGNLELFVGARSIPGRYPLSGPSFILRLQEGGWIPDEANAKAFSRLGLVNGAILSDIDQDGDPDLILACPWSPVRLWLNESGHFREATEHYGLSPFVGWWNGVAVADFNGDGKMDIVASNWGRNSPYQTFLPGGIRAYAGEIADRGRFVYAEAYLDANRNLWVPWRDRRATARAMPWVLEQFATAADYGDATFDQIWGPSLPQAQAFQVSWLDSTLFLNRGDHFDALPLPTEAQFSPAFGVCAGDLDGDGVEDLFLAQNFFAPDETTSRYDGGRGLCLRGRGDGTFIPMRSSESGIQLDGEQRGASLCDFDRDGRLDLVVAQHGAATKLFQNQIAKPGLRIHFKGPPSNRDGVGVQIRALDGRPEHPVHERHNGSGYGGSESATLLLTGISPPTRLSVRWPWKSAIEIPLPTQAHEVEIDEAGRLKVLR